MYGPGIRERGLSALGREGWGDRPRWVAVVLVALALNAGSGADPVTAQSASPGEAVEETVGTVALPGAFSANLILEPSVRRAFSLGAVLPATQPLSLPYLMGGQGVVLTRVPLPGLAAGVRLGAGEDGGPRVLVIGPLSRGWEDLDGWEKFGVVLQTSAAAAGAAMFVKKAAKKVR